MKKFALLMKKFAIVLFIVIVVIFAWWNIRPLLVSDVVDEAFPPVIEEMNQEEIDAMTEEEKIAMEKKIAPVLTASGNFQGADDFHQGSGQASIYQQADGSYFLRFENFSVINGPDLKVYLVEEQNPSESQVTAGFNLGKLKGNKGNQNYVIPAGVDPADYGSVVIYCKFFKFSFATANLN